MADSSTAGWGTCGTYGTTYSTFSSAFFYSEATYTDWIIGTISSLLFSIGGYSDLMPSTFFSSTFGSTFGWSFVPLPPVITFGFLLSTAFGGATFGSFISVVLSPGLLPVAVVGVVVTGSLPLIGCLGLVMVLGSLTAGSFL